MPRFAAHIDRSGVLTERMPGPLARRPLLLVASVGPATSPLQRIDMIRLDAAALTLPAISALRERHACPTLLDLPGPRTRRELSPLTTTELLVYASAERIEWVNLRDADSPARVESARSLLPPSTRVSVSVHSPRVIHGSLGEIASRADAIIFDGRDLARAVGSDNLREHLRCGLLAVEARDRPCLVAGNLLTSMQRTLSPSTRQLDRLWTHLEDGVSGFVLEQETLRGDNPQSCVDILRLMAAETPALPPQNRGGARLGGRTTLAGDHTGGRRTSC